MWSRPVAFVHEKRGLQQVRSSLEALRVLDNWWVKVDGEAYRAAIDICIEAVQGQRSQEDARAAFITALVEGQIDIEPDRG
ncbi:DUF982 domain-containing protein [Cereibacter sp. SYSU M97828]|nr:DUF982 domain-containing protein [Cereibacter flavus]